MTRRRAVLKGSVGLFAMAGIDRGFAAISDAAGRERTELIAEAAIMFLESLDDAQRAAVQFPFTPQPRATAVNFRGGLRGNVLFTGEQYSGTVWSNFPVSDVPRPGLRLGSLDDAQREAAMGLVRALLSDGGYRKVVAIMGSDQALADSGTPYASGRAAYTLGIFGTPGVATLWMVQFGGHHLALNMTLLGAHGVLAPVLTGALPAVYTENGRDVRALAAENDKAFALLHSLDAEQRRQVVIAHPVSELALGPGHDGEAIPPVGVKASALDPQQQAMLLDLIGEWAAMINDVHGAPRTAEVRAGLDDTYIAWSGPTQCEQDRNGAAYFRIQGPTLFIEFSPQEPGGDLTMHVHTIYRDPPGAYGRALVT